jgi:hypothetical protein
MKERELFAEWLGTLEEKGGGNLHTTFNDPRDHRRFVRVIVENVAARSDKSKAKPSFAFDGRRGIAKSIHRPEQRVAIQLNARNVSVLGFCLGIKLGP